MSKRNEEKLAASKGVEEKLLPFKEMKYINWNVDNVEDNEGFQVVSRSRKKGEKEVVVRRKKCQLLILSTS